MMIELLFWIVAGCVLGVFTGLFPGVHVNTIAVLGAGLATYGSIEVVVMLVSIAVVHSFVDFIPAIVLGAPDANSFLSVLPGHEMLMKGLAEYAVKLTVVGGLFAGLFAVFLLPIFGLIVSSNFELIYLITPFVLLLVLLLMILDEKKSKMNAVIAIVLSSAIGLICLQGNIETSNIIFAIVSGLFGASTLLYSMKSKPKIPEQITAENNDFGKVGALKFSFVSVFAGGIVSIFPGIGPNQAAFVARNFIRKMPREAYLIVLGGINTSNAIFAFFVLYLLGKARNGAAAAIMQIINIGLEEFLLILSAIILAIAFSVMVTLVLAKKIISKIEYLDYAKINLVVIICLAVLVGIFSGVLGLVVFAVCTATGLFTISSGIRRSHTMAFLMLPTILLYLGKYWI